MWEWLNGKKTTIGAILIWIATYFIGDFMVNVINFAPEWLMFVKQLFLWVGGLLVPVGVIHKGVKAAKPQ